MSVPAPQTAEALARRKEALRETMRARRRTWSPDGLRQAGAAIVAQVLASQAFRQAGTLAAYLATAHEPETRPLLRTAFERGTRLCVPRYDELQDGYAWAWWTPQNSLRRGPWGLPEPAQAVEGPSPSPQVVLVPVLAIDLKGRRLGHGGGHYDRLLAAATGLKIAVAFHRQILPAVPAGPQDIGMDCLVTETDWHDFRETKHENNTLSGAGPAESARRFV